MATTKLVNAKNLWFLDTSVVAHSYKTLPQAQEVLIRDNDTKV